MKLTDDHVFDPNTPLVGACLECGRILKEGQYCHSHANEIINIEITPLDIIIFSLLVLLCTGILAYHITKMWTVIYPWRF